MRLITIQSTEVYEAVKTKGIVWADNSIISKKSKHIIRAYKRLTEYARKHKSKEFKKYPFWSSFNKTGVTNFGEGKIKLILEVPDELSLLTYYQEWVEYLDYCEYDSSEELWNRYLDRFIDIEDKSRPIQAIIPYIKLGWIVDTESA